MKLTVLGSGSTGNAVLIVAGNTRVLVDAGLSAKEIVRRLAMVGEDVQRLDGVLVTHEHGDHAGGLRVLLGSVDCPVYISAQTMDAYLGERFNVTNEEPRRRAKALRDRVERDGVNIPTLLQAAASRAVDITTITDRNGLSISLLQFRQQ